MAYQKGDVRAVSQRSARDTLGSPEMFRGGVFVTKNGTPELFIQTAEERMAELNERSNEQEQKALLRLVTLAKQDINRGNTLSADQMRGRLCNARK